DDNKASNTKSREEEWMVLLDTRLVKFAAFYYFAWGTSILSKIAARFCFILGVNTAPMGNGKLSEQGKGPALSRTNDLIWIIHYCTVEII
ncbi:MAG: hypothetical protein WAJ93_15625, partial [Candidatus Nitrosopolaris sp.]